MSAPHPFGSPPPSLPPELEARLSASLAAELEVPKKPWWRDAALFVVASVVLFTCGCFMFQSQMPPSAIPSSVWMQSLALLVVALIAGVAALAPWPQRTSRPWILGGLVASSVLVTQVLSMEFGAFSFHLGCFGWELVCSAIPAALAILAARQHAPRLSRAMVLGWAAGTTSLAVMQLKCPHRDVGHLLLFHVTPLLLVVGATMLARRRVSTVSYAP